MNESRKEFGKKQSGFALVVVLVSLTALAILVSAISIQIDHHNDLVGTERQLLALQRERESVLSVFAKNPSLLYSKRLELSDGFGKPQHYLSLNAAGLIDVNAASDELMREFLMGVGVPKRGIENALSARNQMIHDGERYHNPRDFLDATGLDPYLHCAFSVWLTTYTGSSGLNLKVAHPDLLNLLGKSNDVETSSGSDLDQIGSRNVSVNHLILRMLDGHAWMSIGTVRAPDGGGNARVLDVVPTTITCEL